MKDDPEFNAYFVALIKNNECLYDYTCRDYSDRAKQDLAWEGVGNHLNETAAACKERWKNIRACYTRHLLKMKDVSTKHKKPYYLADQLNFLLPFTKSRKRTKYVNLLCSQQLTTNISQDENGGSTDYESDVNCEKGTEYEDREMTENGEIANSPSFDRTPQFTKKAKIGLSKNKRTSYASIGDANKAEFNCFPQKFNCCQIPKTNLEEDADMNFLKSLLPDMKEMSQAQKRRYKIEILQFTQKILSEPIVTSNNSSCFVRCQRQDGSTSPMSETPYSSTWNAAHK